jgi:putative holliday junction resolvase
MRVLGLDVGERKIGLSLSDPTLSIAQSFKLHMRGSLESDLQALKRIVEEQDVGSIVVGLPRNLDGTIGRRARETMVFAEALKEALAVPVVLWDERFSTNEAHRIFDMAQMTQRKRKPYLDMMAAQIILQGYLDARKA